MIDEKKLQETLKIIYKETRRLDRRRTWERIKEKIRTSNDPESMEKFERDYDSKLYLRNVITSLYEKEKAAGKEKNLEAFGKVMRTVRYIGVSPQISFTRKNRESLNRLIEGNNIHPEDLLFCNNQNYTPESKSDSAHIALLRGTLLSYDPIYSLVEIECDYADHTSELESGKIKVSLRIPDHLLKMKGCQPEDLIGKEIEAKGLLDYVQNKPTLMVYMLYPIEYDKEHVQKVVAADNERHVSDKSYDNIKNNISKSLKNSYRSMSRR